MIAFVTDHKFIVSPEGIKSNRFDKDSLLRYADVNNGLMILGRMVMSNDNGENINDEKICFALTNSKITVLIQCIKNLRYSTRIIRLPSAYGYVQGIICLIFKRRYFVELVGDPYYSLLYSSGNVKAARWSRAICKWIVKYADKTAYVNASKLPISYPTKGKSFVLSNVVLQAPRNPKVTDRIQKVGFVGSLESEYKGLGDLIQVLINLRFEGVIDIIGEGKLKPYYISRLKQSGLNFSIADYYSNTSNYIEHIRTFDLYVMSSYTEGLSRTLLDCMNQGILSVSSDAGGSKELLPENRIWRVGDLDHMGRVISEVLSLGKADIANEIEENLRMCESYNYERIWKIRKQFLSID